MTLLNKTPNLKFSLELCEINCKKFIKTVSSVIKHREIRIYFALKTNDSENVRHLIYSTGIGAEVITANELESATKANVNIVVNGHHKSDRMLELAVLSDVDMVNVESLAELKRLQLIACKFRKKVNVGIRIRIDEAALLGFPLADLADFTADQFGNLDIHGLHFHAGWNLRDDDKLIGILSVLEQYIRVAKHSGIKIDTLNFGGSFTEPTEDNAQLFRRIKIYEKMIPDYISSIHFEPGRYIVGNCGMLETRVVEERQNYVIIDSCAYGHKLIGATERVSIIPSRSRVKDYPEKIILSGYWPTESDKIEIDGAEYKPRMNDLIIFNNLGAYCGEWRFQFDWNTGLEYNFDTNLALLRRSMEDYTWLYDYWDFSKDRFLSIPVKREKQDKIFFALSKLFVSDFEWTENEVSAILYKYYDDFSLLRRELIERGYLRRKSTKYWLPIPGGG